MDDEPEVIRQQMEETRSSLTDKIEKLEQQVVGTVQSTTQAVSETVENVKEAVQETVGSVKETVSGTVESVREALDLRGYVERYPWASFGTAVATGFVGGLLLNGSRQAKHRIAGLQSHGEVVYSHGRTAFDRGPRLQAPAEPFPRETAFPTVPTGEEPSWTSRLTERLAPEFDKLKGLALGAVGALVRDLVAQSASGQVGERLTGIIDDVTRKFGGEPIPGSLLQTEDATAEGKSSRERDTASETRKTSAGFAV